MFVDCEIRQLNKNGEELCGDNVEIVKNNDNTIIVLADGLGSGVKASILSTMTKKIAATLLSNGMEVHEVVETLINTLPVCKVRNIAYSTFTIAQIFNSGECRLVEFDNPSVFYVHNGDLIEYDSEILEIKNNKIKLSTIHLDLNDLLILSSDGLVHAGLGRLLRYGLGWGWKRIASFIESNAQQDNDPSLLAEKLISIARELDEKKMGDDTTVVVIRPRKSNEVDIAIGPPAKHEDDQFLVQKIMSSNGKKIVCGGTTSNIFANILNKNMKVVMDESIATTPPKAIIEGLDLVTEGVITLYQASEAVEKINNDTRYDVIIDYEALNGLMNGHDTDLVNLISSSLRRVDNFKPKNPAEELALELIKADRICFVTGKAVNPAHQNPLFPFQIMLKPKLVQELKTKLEKMGKEVHIEYL